VDPHETVVTRPLPARLADPALRELWRRCWRAMARAGPEGWRVVTLQLPLEDDASRRATAGLLGRAIRPGTRTTRVELGELDRLLTRAADGWDLPSVVEGAEGRALPDRAREHGRRREAVASALAQAREAAPTGAWVDAWLKGLDGRTATTLHGRGELELLPAAARVLAALPADGEPLPVLAARTTGDTKALGATTLAGLVLRGLAHRYDVPVPGTAAERRALWEAAGVVPDDLASQALVLGLPGASGLLGGWLTDAAAAGLAFRVTLQQLVASPLEVVEPGPVHVCENPAVLRAASARLGARSQPLVCTEGHPSLACTRLLAGLADAGCEVRYHGDFDWPGLRIASSVLANTGGVPWRFGAEDYRQAAARPPAPSGQRAGEPGSGERLVGEPVPSPWDPDLATAMSRAGRVVYEEDVLDALLQDLANSPEPGVRSGRLRPHRGPRLAYDRSPRRRPRRPHDG
jgi:uncharacterized protein (TIGR02679 family)